MVNPLSSLSPAQRILLTGRQDAAPVWSPLALPNLLLWLDAAAINDSSDGDPLAVWSDRSGHGNDATQATFSRRPTYRVGPTRVIFDGAEDLLSAPTLFAGGAPRTVAVLYRPLSLSGTNAVAGSADVSGGGGRWFILQSRDSSSGAVGDPYLAGFASDIAGPPPTSAAKAAFATFDGATMALYSGATTIGTRAAAALNTTAAAPFLIGGDEYGGNEYGHLEVYGVVVAAAVLSAADRARLCDYWSDTYPSIATEGVGALSGGN